MNAQRSTPLTPTSSVAKLAAQRTGNETCTATSFKQPKPRGLVRRWWRGLADADKGVLTAAVALSVPVAALVMVGVLRTG
jgi:hypothetical protein